jgi:hypothetical protein
MDLINQGNAFPWSMAFSILQRIFVLLPTRFSIRINLLLNIDIPAQKQIYLQIFICIPRPHYLY